MAVAIKCHNSSHSNRERFLSSKFSRLEMTMSMSSCCIFFYMENSWPQPPPPPSAPTSAEGKNFYRLRSRLLAQLFRSENFYWRLFLSDLQILATHGNGSAVESINVNCKCCIWYTTHNRTASISHRQKKIMLTKTPDEPSLFINSHISTKGIWQTSSSATQSRNVIWFGGQWFSHNGWWWSASTQNSSQW